MDEFDELSPKDKLLSMIESEGMRVLSLTESDSIIVIDSCQNPHEIWNGGDSNWVNVCISMPIETALKYLKNPKDFGFPTDYIP